MCCAVLKRWFLARILSPVVGNTDYTVKNSCEFTDFIRDKTLDACEELVSFDVVSLFTKIPVDLAVKVAEERLREDASLGQRTSLPVEDIIHLLSFCIYFQKISMKSHSMESKKKRSNLSKINSHTSIFMVCRHWCLNNC